MFSFCNSDGFLKMPEGTASAYVAYSGEKVITHWARRLYQRNSIFQAEVLAIQQAALWLNSFHHSPGIIYTDSEASLKAIANAEATNPLVRKAQKELSFAKGNIMLTWVRAHCGTIGNEVADLLARQAAQDEASPQFPLPLPWCHFKSMVKKICLNKWQDHWDRSSKGRGLYEFSAKVSLQAPFHKRQLVIFFSGHGPFPSHLKAHQLLDCDVCVCGKEGTRLHYLWECPLTSLFHMNKPCEENELLWKQKLAKNTKSHHRIIELMNFITKNERDLRAAAEPAPQGNTA